MELKHTLMFNYFKFNLVKSISEAVFENLSTSIFYGLLSINELSYKVLIETTFEQLDKFNSSIVTALLAIDYDEVIYNADNLQKNVLNTVREIIDNSTC